MDWAERFRTSQVPYANIIDNNHGNTSNWTIEYANTGARYYWAALTAINFDLTPGVWQHLAITMDSNRVANVFLDGLLMGASTNASPIQYDGTRFFRLGRWGAGGRNWNGQLDEVSVFNRALSTDEVTALYAAGVSGMCLVPFPPVISTQPTNKAVTAGQNATFNVIAGGTKPLSYQWRFNGTNMAGATNSSLTISNAQFGNIGAYSVQVSNVVAAILSSNASLTVFFPPAILRVGTTNAMAAAPVTVPVTLAANGNENTLGFSLNFNPQRLAFAGATLGSGAASATMLVNTTLVATGKLGIVVTFPPQLTFAAGTQEVVRVNFNSLPLLGVSSATATNNFGDQPVLREINDPQLQALSANYSNGTVTLSPTVFEADVFPRTNGNQALTATDWAQTGRFAARLDAAAAGAEFQRADCAPRATVGDGQIKVTDWVQAGRYVAGLDLLAAIGGPTSEVAATPGGPSGSRQLRLVDRNVLQGQTTKVSVVLEAQGDENALGLTLAFNPGAFGFGGVTLGSGASGASLIPNTSQIGAGKLGVLLALPTGSSFSAGSREMMQVNLMASPDVAGPFQISLTDQLVTRCVSDAFANELPVNYVNGTLTVNPINPNPTLIIAQSGTNVILSWPLWAVDFTLQTSEGTDGVQSGWTNTVSPGQTNGSTVSVTLPIASESKFFRLYHP